MGSSWVHRFAEDCSASRKIHKFLRGSALRARFMCSFKSAPLRGRFLLPASRKVPSRQPIHHHITPTPFPRGIPKLNPNSQLIPNNYQAGASTTIKQEHEQLQLLTLIHQRKKLSEYANLQEIELNCRRQLISTTYLPLLLQYPPTSPGTLPDCKTYFRASNDFAVPSNALPGGYFFFFFFFFLSPQHLHLGPTSSPWVTVLWLFTCHLIYT